MKLLTTISTLSLVILLSSCNMKPTDKAAKTAVSADSLAAVWTDAWSNHDSAAIANMLTDKTQIIFTSTFGLTGKDSIMAKWVNPNLQNTGKITNNKKVSGATADMAYYTAGYTREIFNDSAVAAIDKSTFSAVWKLQDDNTWKLEFVQFGAPEK